MARTATISDDQLLLQIMEVFRAEGFDGASLSKLSAATGLKRASLYHRFPGGKNQMAEEALGATTRWLEANVLAALKSERPAPEKLKAAAQGFTTLYDGGKDQCLINLFGSLSGDQKALKGGVQSLLSTLILALAEVIEEAGVDPDEARRRAFGGIVQIQGALVVSQAFSDTAPFGATMARWADDLVTIVPPAEPKTPSVEQQPDPAPQDRPNVRAAVAAHLKSMRD